MSKHGIIDHVRMPFIFDIITIDDGTFTIAATDFEITQIGFEFFCDESRVAWFDIRRVKAVCVKNISRKEYNNEQ